jgi:predicted metalloprotease with PDZ domain
LPYFRRMQKLLFLLSFLPFALMGSEPLTYTISPEFSLRWEPLLQVVVAFDGSPNGVTYLSFQNNQFGAPNQMDFIRIDQQNWKVSVTKEPDSNRFVVHHRPGQRVEVIYEVLDLQDSSQLFYQYCCYKPIIRANYFHVQSGHLLAAPEGYWDGPDARQKVRFKFQNFPYKVIHNSFGPGKDQTVAITNGEFNVAVFVGGDFRRHTFKVQDKPVYLLTRGQWSQFSDDTLVGLLQRTVAGHRSFWNDFSDSIYSVTFLPIHDAPWTEKSKSVSIGGSGLTNSFMSFATDNPGITYDLVRYVWVHELMHHWIGGRIENADEERQYWFSEGFTEYFTLKNSLRYGLITTAGFLEGLNTFASEHYSSPQRSQPNDSINYAHFWNGGKEWEKLPYRRGCLYAFYLDNLIREKSKGEKNLDQLMRQILAAMEQDPDEKLDHAFFIKILRPYAGKASEKAFKRYIEQGKPIDFRKSQLPAGLEVKVKDVTMRSGPSRDIITSTTVLKNIPVFKSGSGISDETLREALLK